ncbi:unnamed protein product [Caretta caretta]
MQPLAEPEIQTHTGKQPPPQLSKRQTRNCPAGSRSSQSARQGAAQTERAAPLLPGAASLLLGPTPPLPAAARQREKRRGKAK